MKIGVDSRPLREKQTSGIPMYVRSLLKALAAIDRENEYILYAHKDFPFELPGPNWTKRSGAFTRYGSVWLQAELPLWLKEDKVDVFWGTQHLLPLAMPKNICAVLTILDLVHYVFPKTMKTMNLLINKFIIPPSVRRADAISTISGWTLAEVKKYLNPKDKIMEVVYLGVGPHFYPRNVVTAKEKMRQAFNLPDKFLLTVGTFEPRKNIAGTFRAFSKIAHKIPHHLAVVGQKGWKNEQIRREIAHSNIQDRIHLLGYLSDDLLPEVYSAADVFMYPSLYEGFGLPPLEAMACAVPVVCSNVSSIPEIVANAALLVDPYSPDDIARGLMEVIDSQSLRYELIGRGLHRAATFSWNNTARQMKRLFQEAYEKKNHPHAALRV